jgi:peptide chain release factor 1
MTFTLDEVNQQLSKLSLSLQSPTLDPNSEEMIELTHDYSKYSQLRDLLESEISLSKQLSDLIELSDPQMAEIVAEEHQSLSTQLAAAQDKLKQLTLIPLKDDEKACIIEVRAGTGGTEAALFAEQLMRMYTRYCTKQKWSTEVSELNAEQSGGIKLAIISVNTRGSYGRLRFESGVHRVQRVPVTESSGRIHTSAASVAVLPQVDAVSINLQDKDIRIDVYRSSGPGGQSVNTTDSAVRVTHLPTGIIVTCQDGKSQLKNKEKALSILRSKLYALEIEKQQAETARERQDQIKTGDRSAKIRTYNFQQSRITDHRAKITWFNIDEVLDGSLDNIIDSMQEFMRS